MLFDEFVSVHQVRSRGELLSEVVGFTRRLGFETVNAMAVVDHFRGESEFVRVDNTPAAYLESFENVEEAHRDPVMQHCKRASVPIIWNQDTYTGVGLGAQWENQARFGYRTGIALALHLPEGRHFFIGVDRDQPLPADTAEVRRMVGELLLFSVHAEDAAMRVLLSQAARVDGPALTAREAESLRWTMDGKTAWEVGNILGISEQTAARHLNNATQKLGCVNKLQAVLKALRLGLIR